MKSKIAVAVIGGFVLAGCGSAGGHTAGIADLPAAEILERTQAVAIAAPSVRVVGDVDDNGNTVSLDMWFKGNEGVVGTLTARGLTFELLRTGDTAFMRADAATWSGLTGDASAGALLADQFVKVAISGEAFADFASFLTWETFISGALQSDAAMAKGSTSEINGIEAIGLVSKAASPAPGDGAAPDAAASAGSLAGSTLWVAANGEPYPVLIERPQGAARSTLAFSEWGSAVDLTAPAEDEVIDLTEIGG